ncbi:MAG TPA: hypothetical protein VE994_00515 [Terriglobales bacterium]|nr:hypothetical protein [Terriglobales bacterium]
MAEASSRHRQAKEAVRILTGQINARVSELRKKHRVARGAEKRALEAHIQLLESVKQTVTLCGWGTGGGGTGISKGSSLSCIIGL